MLQVREATDADVDQIREIFIATYGEDYAYPQFYDTHVLKKLVYADDTLLLVAEETDSERVLGTAAVIMHVGAYNDLVGEFGRLAVHPDARGKGVGGLLMEGRLERVQDQLHLGIVDNRAAHPYSQRISAKHGFACVGFIPNKLLLKRRESLTIYTKHFGPALELRRNNPHVIPEAYRLAEMALANCELPRDAIADEASPAYPHMDAFDLDELTTEGYASLLRFERGRTRHREIFGPMRLHYGLFKLRVRHSHYLLARQLGEIVGAIGFIVDEVERAVRIFELVSFNNEPIRFLLTELLQQMPEKWGAEFAEVDVSAYSPRMQRTLLELGFVPVAYLPAMVFHETERLDAIKMARLFVPVDLEGVVLYDSSQPIAELVIRSFQSCRIQPRVAVAIPDIALFAGLNDEQIQQLAAECTLGKYADGECLFRQGETDQTIHLILAGDVEIQAGTGEKNLATVGRGECIGEMSLVTCGVRSATAVARGAVETAILPHEGLLDLIRRRPDIGLNVYRNFAAGLAEKLRRSTGEPPAENG